jgi:hypothetical protein
MALSVLKDIRKIYAGLNADEIRGSAYQELHVGLIAESDAAYAALEDFLAPELMNDAARAEALSGVHRGGRPQSGQPNFLLAAPGVPAPAGSFVLDPANPERTIKGIAATHPELELAIARRYPRFREAVADQVIHRVSRENALFALVTALPNVIPSVLDLPWAIGEFATDTAFLTMNQIRMALIMAALHGRPVGYREQKVQIATIAAGAFGWRALARELVGKIPLGGGLIPKAAVAFAGTYVVGLGLEKVNRTGVGLSRDERRDAWADAFSKGKEIVQELTPAVAKKS